MDGEKLLSVLLCQKKKFRKYGKLKLCGIWGLLRDNFPYGDFCVKIFPASMISRGIYVDASFPLSKRSADRSSAQERSVSSNLSYGS